MSTHTDVLRGGEKGNRTERQCVHHALLQGTDPPPPPCPPAVEQLGLAFSIAHHIFLILELSVDSEVAKWKM